MSVIGDLDSLRPGLAMATTVAASPVVDDPWLRIAQVKVEVGLHRATIYRWMADGKFPKGVVLAGGQRRWPLSVVQAWKLAQMKA
jgi:prophage regulatory protein